MDVREHKRFVAVAGLVALSCFALATQISGVWTFVLLTWFLGLALQYVPRVGDRLEESLLFLHRVAALAFPVIATVGKYFEVRNNTVERGFLLNAFQHVGWSFCLVLVFAPLLARWRSGLRLFEQIAICIGLACLMGNMNEVFQWSRRIPTAAYYSDTVKDLVMNATGALFAALVLHLGAQRATSLRTNTACRTA